MTQTATTTTAETTEGTVEHTEAAGGEHGGGHFPPLDSKTFPSQIFWLIVFFGLLYWLMKRILPRIGKILSDRKAGIDGDLAHAQSLKDETEASLKAYEKSMSDAKASAGDISRVERDRAAKIAEAEQAKVDAALGAKISDAEARIAKGKAKAMESVEAIANEAAQDIVAALTGGLKAAKAKG
jgi:F-type H+-transporting ATPase subunit b